MKGKVLLVLSVSLLVAADKPKNDKKDLDLMQGTWQVVALESGAGKAPKEALEKSNMRLTIKGNKFVSKSGDKLLLEGTLEINPAKKPKTLDVKGTDPQGKEVATTGIYELNGDTMRVCFVFKGEKRPEVFATKPGSKVAIFEYKRVKP
jgi:uncharacterized protein (TIGR03067 family)